ncbi:hypothetical protein GH714_039736 [Hevea brasiliensis]|uniref:Uncharacterized protein n=1 Tax=Hevea brasiliensis TaxID=3981 RepID=A0A6A6MKP1_HEVBR|nr:hypothetical protein GH714_039736 [Hevea brasiliensis]
MSIQLSMFNSNTTGGKRKMMKTRKTDMGTEYLVQPVGRAEDEEDASDFEPEENGEDEDVEEEDDDGDDDDKEGAGKVEAPAKRKRSDKDDSDDDDGGEDDERPSKR